jgi:hypothetical protein
MNDWESLKTALKYHNICIHNDINEKEITLFGDTWFVFSPEADILGEFTSFGDALAALLRQ